MREITAMFLNSINAGLTFPHPGGPYNKIELGMDRIPFKMDWDIFDGNPKGKMSSSILSFTDAWPMISLNRTKVVTSFFLFFG